LRSRPTGKMKKRGSFCIKARVNCVIEKGGNGPAEKCPKKGVRDHRSSKCQKKLVDGGQGGDQEKSDWSR